MTIKVDKPGLCPFYAEGYDACLALNVEAGHEAPCYNCDIFEAVRPGCPLKDFDEIEVIRS